MADWARDELRIDPEMFVNEKPGCIEVMLETWFDVDAKFGTDTRDNDLWVNLFADYYPETQALDITFVVDGDCKSEEHHYEPSDNEKKLIIQMIEEACQEHGGYSGLELLAKYA